MTQRSSFVHIAILVVFSGISSGQLNAQEARSLDPVKRISQYVLENWSEDDGLPQNTVSSIVSTPDGYLWIGTQEGLVRYNGIDFQVFDKGTSNAFSEDHTIESMLVDSRGRLWVGLGQGLILYENQVFRNLRLPTGETVKTVQSIIEDEKGKIYFATATEGIYYIDRSVLRKDEALSAIQDGIVSSLLPNPDGGIWIGTDDALFKVLNKQVKRFTGDDGIPDGGNDLINTLYLDRQGTVWIGASGGAATVGLDQKPMRSGLDIHGINVTAFLEDGSGTLWIGTNSNGLYRVTASGLENFTADGALSDQAIISLHVDQEGSLWIGTSGAGLSRLRAGKFTTFTKNEGLPTNVIYTVFEDQNEGMWIGTDGGGVSYMSDGKTITYSTSNGLSGDVISGLAEQADGTVWVGTYGNGLNRIRNGQISQFTTRDGLPDDEISALFVDKSDRLWIGTNSGIAVYDNGIFSVTTEDDGLVSDLTMVIKEDHEGTIWVGTWADGLSKITPEGIENVTVDNGLPNDRVFSFHMDDDNVVWIGTYGGGLSRYKDGKYATISMKDGLFNDYIYTILESDDGMLWMTCNKGIFRVDKAMLNDKADGKIDRITSEIFNREDGLKGNEMNGGFQPAGWKGADGRLWFPSMRGVAMINPTDIRRNESIPPVIIESFMVDGIPTDSEGQGSFSSSVEKIEFRFASLSFEAPSRNRFKHRLVGYQDKWESSNGRSATYTNLDPGSYEFQVRASNNDGVWNNAGDSISFRLAPQFFETIWFNILSIAIIIVIAIVLYRYRISQMKLRQAALEGERDKAQEANRFMSVILDNLNHEFRTPLTVILGCSDILLSELTGDKHQFAADIKQHGKRLLSTLDSLLEMARFQNSGTRAEWEEVNIAEIVSELVMMHQATANHKGIDLSSEELHEIASTRLPKKAVQHAISAVVENALKFTEEGDVRITIERDGNFIAVRVADTGMGISRSDFDLIFEPFKQASEGLDRKYEGAGVGLTVARQLTQSMQGTLIVESSGVDGSTFRFRFPSVNSEHPMKGDNFVGRQRQSARRERAPSRNSSRLKTRLRSDKTS